jgi:membrane associated rhomboid family serine protease
MAGIIDRLKYQFDSAPSLKRLIYINVAVFIAVHLVSVVLMLFNIDTMQWLSYIEVPSALHILPYRVWTLFTYMFVHYDLWHILFNMMWLYWFGTIFMQYFSQKHLSVLYVLGGLAGAALYLFSYNVFPYFAGKDGMMCGASASIMAIVFATTLRVPNYKINLMFIGSVSLKYIALVTILIDFLSMTSSNAGGHFAHIGGALMGVIFAMSWNKGKDILRPINKIIDKLVTIWRAPHIKIRRPVKKKNFTHTSEEKKTPHTHKRPETDSEYNARKKREAEEINKILDKVKKSGYAALTTEEKQRLFDAKKN